MCVVWGWVVGVGWWWGWGAALVCIPQQHARSTCYYCTHRTTHTLSQTHTNTNTPGRTTVYSNPLRCNASSACFFQNANPPNRLKGESNSSTPIDETRITFFTPRRCATEMILRVPCCCCCYYVVVVIVVFLFFYFCCCGGGGHHSICLHHMYTYNTHTPHVHTLTPTHPPTQTPTIHMRTS